MTVERWIHQAQRGDPQAFNRLVDRYQGLLFSVAYHQLGGDADDAVDACQEAMLAAWRAMPRFEGGEAGFRAWLVRIVVNACRDRHRYRRRHPTTALEVERNGETWSPPLPDPGQTPEQYAETGDLRSLLDWALSRLSEAHRTVVLLDHAGFSYEEIAEIVGVEVGTIKSRLSRARAHLRDLLAGRIPDRSAAAEESQELPAPDRRSVPGALRAADEE